MPIPTDLVLDLQRRLGYAPPERILSTALREVFPGRIAVVSSFGAESAVLLHLVATHRSHDARPVRRYRPAFPRDARLSRSIGCPSRPPGRAQRRTHGAGGSAARCRPQPRHLGSRRLLRLPQGGAIAACTGGLRRLDQRSQALPGVDALRPAGVRGRRQPRQGQPAWPAGVRPTSRPMSQSIACRRIRWWRKAIPRSAARPARRSWPRRGSARRPLARTREDRMRHPPTHPLDGKAEQPMNPPVAAARAANKKQPIFSPGLSPHLQRLEDEAIHILREVVAEFRRPVMLYSVGKDSSVMLHLARKAFFPAPPPFPFLHIASGWDFRALARASRPHGRRNTGLSFLCMPTRRPRAAGSIPSRPRPANTRG